jgi:hypothetical protein
MVSSSTPKTWLAALPLFRLFSKPRYWLGSAAEKLSLPTKKTMPWPLRLELGRMMPNTNDVEKNRTGPPGERRNRSGVGYTAWPLSCAVLLVTSSRPVDAITAVPSRTSVLPVKPEMIHWHQRYEEHV